MATVFPDPVCEVTRRSRPSSDGSSTAVCTAVSGSNPLSVRARVSSGPRVDEWLERLREASVNGGSFSGGCM